MHRPKRDAVSFFGRPAANPKSAPECPFEGTNKGTAALRILRGNGSP
jgi:hypothetical protein